MALVHLSSSTEEGIFDDRYVQKNRATLHHPIILMNAELTTERNYSTPFNIRHPVTQIYSHQIT